MAYDKNNRPHHSRGGKSRNHNKEHFGYRKENPYKRNYDCFNIRDFREGDSIVVYEDDNRIRGVVVQTSFETREVVYKTANNETKSVSMNHILYLKEYDKDWLNSEQTN